MMDMQTYLMYELFLARRREALEESRRKARRAPGAAEKSPLMARLALAVADGLEASGKMLRRRYEPAAPRIQIQH